MMIARATRNIMITRALRTEPRVAVRPTRALSAAPTIAPGGAEPRASPQRSKELMRFGDAPSVTKFCLFYDYCDDVLEKRGPHRPGHIGLAKQFADEGLVDAGGAFADPVDGALIVFRTREAAESFVAQDPYALNGIVTGSKIREWSTVAF